METIATDNPLPLFYIRYAWDIAGEQDDEIRHNMVWQAMRDFEQKPMMFAFSLVAFAMRCAFDAHDPSAFHDLRDEFMDAITEENAP